MSILHATVMKLGDTFFTFVLQIADFAELNRLRRTSLGTSGNQSGFLAVVAERALKGAPVGRIPLYDSKRARDDAIRTTIADVRLNVDSTKLRTDNRARRTCFQAPGIFAMLAYVRRKTPGIQVTRIPPHPGFGSMLHKFHVPPRGVPERSGVIVGKAAPIEPVLLDPVPFLASHLAGLATNAESRVS
jgi:hypothetical protein